MFIKQNVIMLTISIAFRLLNSSLINLKFRTGAIKKNVIAEIIRILFDILNELKLSIEMPCALPNVVNISFE
tara:strand:+ start:169 stop:384 length:216 start_codon:yes stop_codon:yes gene_type:complete